MKRLHRSLWSTVGVPSRVHLKTLYRKENWTHFMVLPDSVELYRKLRKLEWHVKIRFDTVYTHNSGQFDPIKPKFISNIEQDA